MKQIDILLPFSLSHASMAPSLLQTTTLPALATLIARAKSTGAPSACNAFAPLLPHEAWLARQFGLANRMEQGNSPPIATLAMQALGLQPDAGLWFMLQPVHLHVARDHLILDDLRRLKLTQPQSRDLFDAAKPFFDAAGKTLLYGAAQTWFVRSDAWDGLQTSTPDAACGHNIDIWLPHGPSERDWRKLHNDVQMQWHTHAVNAARDAQQLPPVNALWLWGGAVPTLDIAPCRYTEVINLPGWTTCLEQLAPTHRHNFCASQLRATAPGCGLLVLDALIEPALAGDESEWQRRLHQLETDWFAPLLTALKTRTIDRIQFILTHHSGLSTWTVTRSSLRQFWIKTSLARLVL